MSPMLPTGKAAVPGRRTFLGWLTLAAVAAAAILFAVPFLGYILSALRPRREAWIPVGSVKGFPLNHTRLVTFVNALKQPWDGMAANTGAYVRYLGKKANGADDFVVFAVNCTHLGCPVSWFPQSGLFMCPCHGGVYYANGEHASGPPPRGLYHCVWQVNNAILEIQAPHLPTLQDTLTKPAIAYSKPEKKA